MSLRAKTFGDYPPLMQKFIDFWGLLNAARISESQGPFVLPSGATLATLTLALTDLNAAIEAVAMKETERSFALPTREADKILARDTMDAWKKRVESVLRRTPYADNLPTLPGLKVSIEVFMKPLDDVKRRWMLINAAPAATGFTPPLELPSGVDLVAFEVMAASARTSSQAVDFIDEQATVLRNSRDVQLPGIKIILEDFRASVLDFYPKNSVWVETLPKMNEKSTVTPPPVVLKSVYNAVTSGWDLSWKAPDDLDIARFSVRIAAGPRYKSDSERVVGDLTPQTLSFFLDATLVPAGATVWAKVYVVNETGNEAGSNAARLVV